MPVQCTRDNTDANMLADLDAAGTDLAGWIVEEFPEMTPNGFVDGNKRWQVIFNADDGRAGLVFLGSGSSGHTLWTDAVSCAHAYERMQNDDLSS